jgi:hypothetical protein
MGRGEDMKFIVGVAVGLVLGVGASALADSLPTWNTGADLMDRPPVYRGGYTAGASDMLEAVVRTNQEGDLQFAASWFAKQARCLNDRSKGRLGQFIDFAETLWRGRDKQAASILLNLACQ